MMKKIAVYWDNFLYKKILKNLLKTSKLGYGLIVKGAEFGTNFEHIYDNKSQGQYLIGKIIDRVLLNLPAVCATRGRKDDIKKILWNEIHNNQLKKKTTKVLDLASGGARYLRELNKEHELGYVESICIDRNLESINMGVGLIKKEKIKNLKFFRGNIFKLQHLKQLSSRNKWIPNVIVASGIFIYFNDEIVMRMISEIYDFLPVGALLVFSSYEKLNTKKLMRKTMQTSTGEEWTLYYRKPEFWRGNLDKLGFKDIFISRDQWQMNNICMARK